MSGMAYLHGRNICHGDLKCENGASTRGRIVGNRCGIAVRRSRAMVATDSQAWSGVVLSRHGRPACGSRLATDGSVTSEVSHHQRSVPAMQIEGGSCAWHLCGRCRLPLTAGVVCAIHERAA